MVSEFEAFKNEKQKRDAFEYAESQAEETHWYCPNCDGRGFLLSDDGCQCINCGLVAGNESEEIE